MTLKTRHFLESPRELDKFFRRTLPILAVTIVLAGCAKTHPTSPGILDTPPPSASTIKDDDPASAPKFLRIGESALRAGEDALAVSMFRKAIGLDPNLDVAHLELAATLADMQDYAGASQEYQGCLSRNPQDFEAEAGLGRLDLAQHHPDTALTKFRAAAALGATGTSIDNLIGYTLDLLGDHKQAQVSYVAGLAINPDDKVLRNNYGLSLALSGDYQKAISILTALAQEPDATPRNRQNLALALGLSGDLASARIVAAHDLGPDEIQNNLRYYDYVRPKAQPDATPQ